MKTVAFAIALMAATPAFADNDRRAWVDLWRNCAMGYVQAYPGHCANFASRAERNRNDIGTYFRRERNYRITEQAQRQWCRNNPAYCADGEPRHYGRR